MVEKSHTPEMFSEIASRYDLLNRVLSFNADRGWRRALVDTSGVRQGGRVLDVASGTGDVAIEFERRSMAGTIVGLDRSPGMLAVANRKLQRLRLDRKVKLVESDALKLPFDDGVFDVAAIAFGLRNLPDYAAGVGEMARVLRPGGRLLVMEFFPPGGGLWSILYRLYLGAVLPVVGRAVSGSKTAYDYLSSSIRSFATHNEVRGYMKAAGIDRIQRRDLTGGISCIYHGVKS